MKQTNKIVREITPTRHYCGVGTCPSVFDTGEKDYLIIGKVLKDQDIPEEVKAKIGPDECVVSVPRGIIDEL